MSALDWLVLAATLAAIVIYGMWRGRKHQHLEGYLLADRQMTLELSPEAIALLCERGYEPAYGARPLKRAIQRYLQDPLAKRIIAGDFHPGDHILISAHSRHRVSRTSADALWLAAHMEGNKPA